MFGAPPPRKTSTARSTLSVHSESDALPFGRLWYGEPDAISNAIGYAKFFSRSHHAVICVFDKTGNVFERTNTLDISKSGSAIKTFATTGSVGYL